MADVQLRDVGEALDQTLPALDVRYFAYFSGGSLHLESKHLAFAVRDAGVANCKIKENGKVKIVMDEYSITIDPKGGVLQGGSS